MQVRLSGTCFFMPKTNYQGSCCPPMIVAIYTRVSSDCKAEKELFIPAQVKAILQYCKEQGMVLNAKQGYNNGGFSPYGYRTEHIY